MGRSSRRKQKRRKLSSLEATQQALNSSPPAMLPKPGEITEEFSSAILMPTNSILKLRGDEPQCRIKNGQLLLHCDKMAVISLEEYDQLLQAYGIVQHTAAALRARQRDAEVGQRVIATPTAAQVAQANRTRG